MEAFQKQLPGSTESEFPFAGHGSDFHAHEIEQIQRLLAKLLQSPNIHSTTYGIKTVITSGQVYRLSNTFTNLPLNQKVRPCLCQGVESASMKMARLSISVL